MVQLAQSRLAESLSEERYIATLGDRDDASEPCVVRRRRLLSLVGPRIVRCRSAEQWRDAVYVRGGGAGRDEPSADAAKPVARATRNFDMNSP